jgi:uncharacterized protein (TIGR03118 family)
MKKHTTSAGMLRMFATGFMLLAVIAVFNGCIKHNTPKALKDFNQVNLVANNNKYSAAHIDPVLLNAWGLAFSGGGTAWVSAQAGHVSTVYDKEGVTGRPPVNIPSPGGATGGNPTGVVFSSSATDFMLSNGQAARFIFVGLDGILSAWSGAAGNNALLIKNNSATSVYTGLTLAANGGANFLYAADFKAGKIAVWDKNFAPVTMAFKDPHLPSGYSPFNIQVVGSWLYVMYAKVGPEGDEQKGLGNGYVSIFTTAGSFVKRFASKGTLNAPWGIASASAAFFADTDGDKDDEVSKYMKSNNNTPQTLILVGNFGDGRINAYTTEGDFVGQLRAHGHTMVIDGLWALSFPPATATTIDPNRLYFTAGPDEEADGLFGYIIKE